MVPPWAWTISPATAKPIPEPTTCSAARPRQSLSKTRGSSSASIPGPVSSTTSTAHSPSIRTAAATSSQAGSTGPHWRAGCPQPGATGQNRTHSDRSFEATIHQKTSSANLGVTRGQFFTGDQAEVDLGTLHRGATFLGRRQLSEVAHHAAEPQRLVVEACEPRRRRVDQPVAQLLEPRLESRERRAQLVGDVAVRWRRSCSERATVSAIVSNARAVSPSSPGLREPARACRSPAANAWAAEVSVDRANQQPSDDPARTDCDDQSDESGRRDPRLQLGDIARSRAGGREKRSGGRCRRRPRGPDRATARTGRAPPG